MRNIVVAMILVALPISQASAEPLAVQKPDKLPASGRLLPVKRAGAVNSCAAYGAGFIKVEGTETCVKIGGAVSIGVGGTSGGR